MEKYTAKVREVRKETSDSYSVLLEIPEGYTWIPGQFTSWEFADHKVEEGDKEYRIFSIASTLDDGYLMFTTRISEKHTSFKDIILHDLKPGDEMLIKKANGQFRFHEEYQNSFVMAGGIGITPIRSILKNLSLHNTNKDKKVTVIYSDDRGEFCYTNDIKEFLEALPNLKIHLVSNRDETNKILNEYVKEHMNDSEYLIAGSPGMNKAVSASLVEKGIDAANIKTDNFVGY